MHPDLAKLVALQQHDLEAKRLRDEMGALAPSTAALEAKAKATVGQRAASSTSLPKKRPCAARKTPRSPTYASNSSATRRSST